MSLLIQLIHQGPWEYLEEEYWARTYQGLKGQALEPFKICVSSPYWRSSWRAAHELAHLLMCEDQHVLDPFWGNRVFITPEVGVQKFPLEVGLRETQVTAVGEYLYRDDLGGLGGQRDQYCRKTVINETLFQMKIQTQDPQHHLIDHCTPELAQEHAGKAYDEWTPERIRQEAARKYDLIRALRGPGQRPVETFPS